jgi:hypothetical protein
MITKFDGEKLISIIQHETRGAREEREVREGIEEREEREGRAEREEREGIKEREEEEEEGNRGEGEGKDVEDGGEGRAGEDEDEQEREGREEEERVGVMTSGGRKGKEEGGNEKREGQPLVLHIAPKNLGSERPQNYLQLSVLPRNFAGGPESEFLNSLGRQKKTPRKKPQPIVSAFQKLYDHHLNLASTCRKNSFINPEILIFSMKTDHVDYSNGIFEVMFSDSEKNDQILEDSEKLDVQLVSRE